VIEAITRIDAAIAAVRTDAARVLQGL
jgi:hypothetical protein